MELGFEVLLYNGWGKEFWFEMNWKCTVLEVQIELTTPWTSIIEVVCFSLVLLGSASILKFLSIKRDNGD